MTPKRIKRSVIAWDQLRKHIMEDKPLTTFEVSKICGVVHSTVSNWIDDGKLNAYKTPGGHRRIKREDMLVFLKLYDMPVPQELLSLVKEGFGRSGVRYDRNGLRMGKRILIVEDDPNVSEVLLEWLKKTYSGFEFAQARDGFQAGKQIAVFAPELVILDLILPGIDGFKVLENIRKDASLPDIKVIAITGFDNSENREKIRKAGSIDGLIIKPINLNRLKEQINRLLGVVT